MQRGLHTIEDELVFPNHDDYIFHDSRGFEAGSEHELKIFQEFVLRKLREKRLKKRLHAIWFAFPPLSIYSCELPRLLFRYCIPMDNDRPLLDLQHFERICADMNGMSKNDFMKLALTLGIFQVPVIAVFTKYEQFSLDIEMKLEDQGRNAEAQSNVVETESVFNQQYLANLMGAPPYIRLQSEVSMTVETYTILISLVKK